MSISIAKAATFEKTSVIKIEKTTATDELRQKIERVRKELASAGFSQDMMNDLFGDESFYFPSNKEKLELVLHIVDLLIENQQYEEADKEQLISLANEAYAIYMSAQTTDSAVTHDN